MSVFVCCILFASFCILVGAQDLSPIEASLKMKIISIGHNSGPFKTGPTAPVATLLLVKNGAI